jgi:hypothetical protein
LSLLLLLFAQAAVPQVTASQAEIPQEELNPGGNFRAETRKGIHITTETHWPQALRTGYFPVRIRLENQRDTAVTLDVSLRHGWYDRTETFGTINLEPGEARRLDWLGLFLEENYSDEITLVLEEGLQQIGQWSVMSTLPSSSRDSHMGAIVIGEDAEKIAKDLRGRQFFVKGGPPQDLTVGFVPINRTPTDWRAWSSLRLVILRAGGQPLPAEAITGLADWVSLGGLLVVEGVRKEAVALLASGGLLLDERLKNTGGPADLYRFGFGQVVMAGGESSTARELMGASPMWTSHYPPPNGPFPGKLARQNVLIPGIGLPPIKIFLLVLIAFALVVGPFQFQRLKKKTPFAFLIWTPILGIGFTGVLLGWSLLSHGLHVQESTVSITWLNQQTKQASTLAFRHTFSGSILHGGLHYKPRTAAVPGNHDPTNQKDFFVRDMNLGGALTDKFFPVRLPFHELQANVQTARQKVAIEKEGKKIFAVNGMETDLLDFVYHAEDSLWWHAPLDEPFKQGQRILLTLGEPPPPPHLAGLHHEDLPQIPGALPSRSWQASLVESNFLDDGGIPRERVGQDHLIIGIMEAMDR